MTGKGLLADDINILHCTLPFKHYKPFAIAIRTKGP